MLMRLILISAIVLVTLNVQASMIKIIPSTVTVMQGSEAKYYLLAQEKDDVSKNISLHGLPEGATWSLVCTGTRGDNCKNDYGSNDLPIFTLNVSIPPTTKNGNYNIEIQSNLKNSITQSFKLQVVEPIKFSHPGILLNAEMLANIKNTLLEKDSMRYKALLSAKNSTYGNLNYKPHPHSSINSDDQTGVDYREDAIAAYTQGLLWYITDDNRYADNAIAIMNAWSQTLNSNLQGANRFNLAAWSGDVWPRAAEIIRSTYLNSQGISVWSSSDINNFSQMLKKYTIEFIEKNYFTSGNYGGNLLSSQATAFINIGIFNNDTKTFLEGVDKWRKMLPAYIYMKNDGTLPMPPYFWRNSYISSTSLLSTAGYWRGQQFNSSSIGEGGLSQETCRDIGHVIWGLSALANGLESARIQGYNLSKEETLGTVNAVRLKYGSEYNTNFYDDKSAIQPDSVNNPCGKKIDLGSSVGKGEVLLDELTNRNQLALPNSELFIKGFRPTGASYFMIWETLTHYQNP
ncbi:Alginate lyase [Rosenbergiella nectarea]|uniref:Alginate lyase n=1 Tax=Rosenbergiella nectarea TaxID=988801 RepID=A0A1H9F332_9GAMM|nr:alginate lyase family protein [Rosenbergiella nectarea]SEQ32297.1 Alginate lyase [Rosenbergiella nectarea]